MESKLERKFVKAVESIGGKSLKFNSASSDALPDRINLFSSQYTDMAEIKDGADKELRPKQKVRVLKFRELGYLVFEIYTEADIKKYLLHHLLK